MWASNRLVYVLTPLYFIAICLFQLMMHAGGVVSTICPQLPPITLYSSPEQIMQCYGGMDIASYIRGAFALQEHGLYAFSSLGFATWPPGFSFLELALIRIGDVPLPLALFLIGSILWALVFFRIHALVKQLTGIAPAYAAVLPLLLLIVPFVSGFYLWGGMLMSEPISTALFAIAALDVWRHVACKLKINIVRAIFIGVLFALAVYIRAQFDLIFHAMSAMSLLIIVACFIYPNSKNKIDKRYVLKDLAVSLLVIFLTFQAFVLPYKAFMLSHGHGPAMANVNYIFESLWKEENWHIQRGAGFFSDGGGHSMCAVSADKCLEFEARRTRGETISIDEYKQAAFGVALTQPFSLLEFKWPYLWKSWKINNLNDGADPAWSPMFNVFLFLIIFVTAIGRCIQNRLQGMVETAYFLSLFAGATIFCFIVHFEARYLLPVKFFVVVWALVFASSLASEFFRNRKARFG